MNELVDWCLLQLGVNDHQAQIQPVSGDASFRRYYRLSLEAGSFIAVNAPPATERNESFIHISALLAQVGVHVPTVLAADLERGFLLLTDLGDQLLLPLLDARTVDAYYRSALDTLRMIQTCPLPVGEHALPLYNEALLQQEMSLMPEWFVVGLLERALAPSERALLERTFNQLCQSALEQPAVFVHRDYHSRNLMVGPGEALAVIDFQDAVKGPVTYDAVSLLRDCYVAWPEVRVRQWVGAFRANLKQDGQLSVPDPATFQRWFDWMGLQRHIKVLGIFARLWLRDGKPGYLGDLPLVMHYTLSVAKQYPQLALFVDWLEQEIWPLARAQPWYREPEIRS